MARIVLSSQGTYGDFRPFLGLGRRLAGRGHRVCLAVNPAFVPEAQAAGLDAVPTGARLDAVAARREAGRFDARLALPGAGTWNLLDLEGNYRAVLAACRDADLLVAASLQQAGPMVAETLGLPWAVVSLLPQQFPLSVADSPADGGVGRPLAPADVAAWLALRARLGLRRLGPDQFAALAWSAPLILLAASPHFCPLGPGAAGRVHPTGFWFEGGPSGWKPSPVLAAFLTAGPAPLALTFSSLPLADPGAILGPVVAAAAAIGRRLVVQRGWADFSPEQLPSGIPTKHVHWVDFVPHDWLFAQVAAVVHHGGVGTTAEALRAGRPAVVIPFGNDQPFNAGRVSRLGVGAVVEPADVTAKVVAFALTRVLADDVHRAAAALANRLLPERGLDRACELLELLLAHSQLGRRSPIPKVLHQLAPVQGAPVGWGRLRHSWQAQHPHWEYRTWSGAEVRQLVADHFPELLLAHDGPARSAVARAVILDRLGGVFADAGLACRGALDLVVAGRELVIASPGVVAARPSHPVWADVRRQLSAGDIEGLPVCPEQ